MSDFGLLCKAIAGSVAGARIRKKNKKGKQNYSFFSSNLFSQIMAGLLISIVFGFQFYVTVGMIAGSGAQYIAQFYSNTITSYFIAMFGLCILNVLNIFFLSKNDEAIVAFPIAPGKIFLARMVLSIGYAVLYSLLFLTISIIYLIFVGGSVMAYISAVVIFITLPLIFIAISFIIINTIGLLVNFKKHRKIAVIISIFVSIIAFAAFYLPSILGDGETSTDIISSLATMNSFYSYLNWISFVPLKAVLLEGDFDWVYLILQIVIALAAVGLSYLYANATYINNIGLEEGKSKKKVSGDETERKINKAFNKVSTNGLKSYVYRSIKEVLHSPQIAMIYIFVPLFVALLIGTSFAFALPEVATSLPAAYANNSSLQIIIITGCCIIASMTMTGSSIAISSENKNIALIKSSPIDPERYLESRIFLSVSINLITSIFLSVIFVIVGGYPAVFVLYILLEIIPGAIFFNYLNLWCDLIIPRFNWNNIAEITNNSWKPFFNLIINFLGWIVMIGICCLFIFVPNDWAFIGPVTVCLIFTGLVVLFRKLSSKRFNSLMNSDISY